MRQERNAIGMKGAAMGIVLAVLSLMPGGCAGTAPSFSSAAFPSAALPSLAPSPAPSLAPMLETVLPGVVGITVDGRLSDDEMAVLADPDLRRSLGLPRRVRPEEREFRASGSGVVVDAARGIIVTAGHIVHDAERIEIALNDGRRLAARLAAVDPDRDVAVLRVGAAGLTAVPVGDSDRLRVGDFVVAVGNPFGLAQAATLGIVSAIAPAETVAEKAGETGTGGGPAQNGPGRRAGYIQTDAAINPGNSGGALVDVAGRLVGITSVIVGPAGTSVGIGFAIPVRTVMEVAGPLSGPALNPD